MHKLSFNLFTAAVIFATSAVANAAVHRVFPGESIQAAIDVASRGDTNGAGGHGDVGGIAGGDGIVTWCERRPPWGLGHGAVVGPAVVAGAHTSATAFVARVP